MNRNFDQAGSAVTEAALLHSVLDIAASTTLAGLAGSCFAALRAWMGADTLGLYLFAGDGCSDEIRFAENVPDGFLEDYDRNMRADDLLLRHVIEARQPASGAALHGLDVWKTSPSRAYLRRWGFDQTVIGPLVVDGAIVGTVDIATSDRDGPYAERDVERFGAICRATSIALGAMRDWSPPSRRTRPIAHGVAATRTVLSRAATPAPRRPPVDGTPLLVASLPPRAGQVAQLVCQGATNKEIGRRLDLSPYTVRDHVQELFRRFDVGNRTELVTRLLGFDARTA